MQNPNAGILDDGFEQDFGFFGEDDHVDIFNTYFAEIVRSKRWSYSRRIAAHNNSRRFGVFTFLPFYACKMVPWAAMLRRRAK